MSAMSVFATSCVPPGIRGALNQWLIEVLPGVYVGRPSARVREYLWGALVEALQYEEKPYAALICQSSTEQGFEARTVGDHRYALLDFDGLQLVTVAHKSRSLVTTGEGFDFDEPDWGDQLVSG